MKLFKLTLLSLLLLGACRALEEPVPAPVTDEEHPSWLPTSGFQWTKAEDVETRAKFLRNFGVGYSYNAVRGSFCDWTDIRCQIVNRQVLDAYQDWKGEMLRVTNVSKSVSTYTQFNYSKRDYVSAVHLELQEKVNLGLYHKEKRTRQDFIEDGVEESFYYSLAEDIVLADCFISPASVLYNYEYNYEECGNFLTLSFVNAVMHVAESDPTNIAVVDSLVNIYGTHVITQAWLGGKIRVDLSNYMWRYKDTALEDKWTSSQFLNACASKDENRTGKDEYMWLEHGKLNITAYGGDQSTLTNLLGEYKMDGTRTFSIDGIFDWSQSLHFDPENELNSNVEMIDMRLTPIWEFAAAVDEDAAERIKAAILQDVSLQQSLLGENNFFDTCFPIRYPTATAKIYFNGNLVDFTRTDSADMPMVVNIVSGGRYVACVCHETIGTRDLWVCYPIYEGKIKMPCGVGVDQEGRAYTVQWLNGNATVLRMQSDVAGDMFYINGGEVCVESQEGVTYADAFALPYIEIAGGVQPDGSVDGVPYVVERSGQDFIIDPNYRWKYFVDNINGTRFWGKMSTKDPLPSNLIGWTSDGHREDNYLYIYNPNELRP